MLQAVSIEIIILCKFIFLYHKLLVHQNELQLSQNCLYTCHINFPIIYIEILIKKNKIKYVKPGEHFIIG